MAGVEVEIFFVSTRVAAGVRSRAGIQSQERAACALLRADAQFDQLRALAHCQSGIEPRALEWLRWIYRAGLDRDFADAERLPWQTERADIRDRVSGIWGDAKPGAFDRAWCLVFERSDRGQSESRLERLSAELGVNAGRFVVSTGGLAVRSGAV